MPVLYELCGYHVCPTTSRMGNTRANVGILRFNFSLRGAEFDLSMIVVVYGHVQGRSHASLAVQL